MRNYKNIFNKKNNETDPIVIVVSVVLIGIFFLYFTNFMLSRDFTFIENIEKEVNIKISEMVDKITAIIPQKTSTDSNKTTSSKTQTEVEEKNPIQSNDVVQARIATFLQYSKYKYVSHSLYAKLKNGNQLILVDTIDPLTVGSSIGTVHFYRLIEFDKNGNMIKIGKEYQLMEAIRIDYQATWGSQIIEDD